MLFILINKTISIKSFFFRYIPCYRIIRGCSVKSRFHQTISVFIPASQPSQVILSCIWSRRSQCLCFCKISIRMNYSFRISNLPAFHIFPNMAPITKEYGFSSIASHFPKRISFYPPSFFSILIVINIKLPSPCLFFKNSIAITICRNQIVDIVI